MTEYQPLIGIEERDTESGIHVFRIHYTADPMKRDPDVIARLAEGVPGGTKSKAWRREMEIDWTVGSGLSVYGDVFIRDWHVAKEPLLYNDGLPVCRGWDLGATHQFPACVWAQSDAQGRIYVLREQVSWDGRTEPKAVSMLSFAETVASITKQFYPGAECMDWVDPSAWGRSMTDERSCADILRDYKIYPRRGAQTFTERRTHVESILSQAIAGKPRLVIDPRCVMLIEGLSGAYRYEEIGETGRYKPTVEKNAWSHVVNAFEYLISGVYIPYRKPAKYDIDDEEERKQTRKRGKPDPVTGY